MVRIRGRHLLILLFFALVFSGCKNELISEIAHYYSPGVQAHDIRPPQINASNIATGDLTLALSVGDGSTVSWETSSHSGIAVNGQLIQPSFTQSDITANITATVSSKSGRKSRFTFEVIVPAMAATDTEAVTAAAAVLTPGYQGGDTASHVTNNLAFVTSGLHATQISWNASALSSITNSGTVTRPSYLAGDELGTLQATVSKGIATTVVSFSLTVIRLPIGDALAVTEAAAALAIQYQSGDSASSVTGNLGFPSTGLHSTNVSWDASALSSVLNSGVVNQPFFADGNETGIIAATVQRGTESDTVNFPITVITLPISDSESVSMASAALAIIYATGDLATSVTENLGLATIGLHGTTVSWNTSALASVSSNGTVSRPPFMSGDESGTLVATVRKGSESSSVNFPITVVRLPMSDTESVNSVADDIVNYIIFADGDSDSSVTDDVTLSTSGAHDTSIMWNTDGHPNIDSLGNVNTHSAMWWLPIGHGVTGDIVATITKNSVSVQETYSVVVISESVDSPPTPASYTFPGRSIQFPRPFGGEALEHFDIQYRQQTSDGFGHTSLGAWLDAPAASFSASSTHIQFSWSTASIPIGNYQFRFRLNRNGVIGSWASTPITGY